MSTLNFTCNTQQVGGVPQGIIINGEMTAATSQDRKSSGEKQVSISWKNWHKKMIQELWFHSLTQQLGGQCGDMKGGKRDRRKRRRKKQNLRTAGHLSGFQSPPPKIPARKGSRGQVQFLCTISYSRARTKAKTLDSVSPRMQLLQDEIIHFKHRNRPYTLQSTLVFCSL